MYFAVIVYTAGFFWQKWILLQSGSGSVLISWMVGSR